MKRVFLSLIFVIVSVALFGCSFDILEDEETHSDQSIDELEDIENFRPHALEHILEGELNKQGQAVGFHYEGLASSKGEIVKGTATPPDENGVYEAEVMVEEVEKQSNHGTSTFYPKEWHAQDVVDAINEAYDSKEYIQGNTYAGMTEEGIVIQMYLDDENKIISAFPVYEGA